MRFTPIPSRSRLQSRLAVVIVLLAAALTSTIPERALSHPGRWTPPALMPATAVHMTLLRGDLQPFAARVVWWQEEQSYLGQWGWRNANLDGTAAPDTSYLKPLGIPDPGGPRFFVLDLYNSLTHVDLWSLAGPRLGPRTG